MLQIYEEINVDNNTYVLDGNKEITLADVSSGYWVLGFDRDGTCFEMTKISRSMAKDFMFDYGNYKLKDLDVTDFGVATYYWNEETCDGGILLVH